MYASQFGQDKYLDEHVFSGERGLFYVEVGAANGISHSNTLFFEKERAWKGLCVEPRKEQFEQLKENRNCLCENCCVSDFEGEASFREITGYANELSGLTEKYDPRHVDRIERETEQYNCTSVIVQVEVHTLPYLLEKHTISKVDYLSVDTEGGEEDILHSINFRIYNINTISVELNYDPRPTLLYMQSQGYAHIHTLGPDLILKKV